MGANMFSWRIRKKKYLAATSLIWQYGISHIFFRLYDDKGNETKTNFPSGGNYTIPGKQGSFDLKGDRVTKLGTNM